MKRMLLSLALAPLAACGREVDVEAHAPSAREEQTGASAEEGYLAASERRLEELGEEIRALEEKLAERASEVPQDMQDLMASLDERRRDATERLAALREASGDAWQSARERLDRVFDDLQASIEEAMERIGS